MFIGGFELIIWERIRQPIPNPRMNSDSPLFRRLLPSGLLLVILPLLNAQTAPKPPSTTPASEEAVMMSTFLVSSTQDKRYTATNASTVIKTNESLLEFIDPSPPRTLAVSVRCDF